MPSTLFRGEFRAVLFHKKAGRQIVKNNKSKQFKKKTLPNKHSMTVIMLKVVANWSLSHSCNDYRTTLVGTSILASATTRIKFDL